jgi:ABC-type branched-subunit amino acid transport system substrate-binding protein
VSAARRVIASDASCITGTMITPDTIAIAQSVTIRQSIPVFPLGSSEGITQLEDDDTVYRAIPPDSLQSVVLADAMEDTLGGAEGKVVAVAYVNEPYGEGIATKFEEEWTSRGGEISGPVAYDAEQPSYNSEASQLVSGNPDGWLFADYPDSYAKVGAALVRSGQFDPSQAVTGDSLFLEELPPEIPAESLEGAITVSIGEEEETETAQAFDDLWNEAPGPDRLALDTHVFDNNLTCFLAAVAAGSSDPAAITEQLRPVATPPGETYTFLELDEAIAALGRGEDIDFQGVSGPLDFDENGDPTGAVYDVYRYENGKAEFVEQVKIGA